MKIRIREGNDFDVVWAITRAGQPEDLSTATNMKLTLVVYGATIEHNLFTVTDNVLSINIPKEVATIKGDYRLVFEYTLPDAGQPDGDLKCKTDVVPFRIVPFTADADDVYTVNTSSDVLLGFKGDKGDGGDDAYQIWLDLGNVGTYEDFIAYLRQPAVGAGDSISELEGEIQVSEGLRVSAETARVNAEGDATKGRVKAENERVQAEIIRQNNEGNRIENEATRVQDEAERNSKENVRQNSEADRIGAEEVRAQAESERVQAETARVNAEGDATKGRVKAENERVAAEGERAAAETARVNAEGDATKGRVKAENERVAAEGERAQAFAQMMGEADDKIEEMGTTLSTYDGRVTQVESDISQLAGDVSLLDAVQGAKIKDIENVLSTANIGQSAKISVTGTSPLSLPKNAANSGMSVKMEGLTQDVGGVITNFEPTGRVRSVDKNGLNPTALYLTAPELRSNGTVKDEIRKGANGYELVKRISDDKQITSAMVISLTTTLTNVDLVLLNIKGTFDNVKAIDGYLGWIKIKGSFEVTIANRDNVSSVGGFNVGTGSQAGNVYFIVAKNKYADVNAVKAGLISDYALSTLYYELATPVITPISYGGILSSAENGTVYHEPVIADAGVYSTNMPILLTDYPISAIEEIIKHENGVDTYLNVATAVVAPDGLSFTHPDLTEGDLVLFTYAFDKESTNGNITATFYDSNVVKIDTVTGKAYKITDVVTNGVLTRTLTEV